MNVTIEHIFCPYCEEVINLYFRIMNTILFSCNEAELRTSMERLKKETMGHIICGFITRKIKSKVSNTHFL